jgi:hypothetical protein
MLVEHNKPMTGTTLKNASPKSTLKKEKLQPFGSHYMTRLSSINNKLVCSLSASAVSDVITDDSRQP